MVRLRSGRNVNTRGMTTTSTPFRVGDAMPPAGPGGAWPDHRIAHLSQGVKIALDYLNLPVPPVPGGLDPMYTRNQRRAKKYALQARRWAMRWYEISKGTPEDAANGPGLVPPASYAAANYKCKWADVATNNANMADLDTWHPQLWFVSGGVQPADRLRRGGVILALGWQTIRDNRLRLSSRHLQTMLPKGWHLEAAASRALIQADADAYDPLAGGEGDYPHVVSYDDLTTDDAGPGLAVPVGCFMARLPEFLCQLGGKSRLSDFL